MITRKTHTRRLLARGLTGGAMLLLGALSASGDPPTPRPVGGESEFKRKMLDNGLEVIVIVDKTVPLVTVDVVVRNGAFTEPNEFAGLSHLYEHMFFKSNAAYKSQEEYMDRVQELGIAFNGYTSTEVVNYYFTLPSTNLSEGMKFMADAIMTPRFETEELVKERQVVIGEFDRNEAQPTFVLRYAIDSAMWNPHVSRKQALGQRNVILTATVEKMELIRNRFYVPNNSALIVSGDVEAEEVFELAEEYYAKWERAADPFPTYNAPDYPALKPTLVVRKADIPLAQIQFGWHGPSLLKDEPDPYVADVLFTMANQPTSRFYHELVDSGIVASVYIGYQSARNTGEISIYAQAIPGKEKEAISAIKKELIAMSKPGYFTDDDLKTSKQILADGRVFDRENVFTYTIQTVPFWWSSGGSIDYYEALNENMNNVTMAQTQDFMKRFVIGKPFVLGVGAKEEKLSTLKLTEAHAQW